VAETTCSKCKRGLSDPQSIRLGMGPVCYSKHLVEKEREKQEQDIPLTSDPDGDIICTRDENGRVITNIPHLFIRHSPDGFEWGYGGSGPADLALNILSGIIGLEAAQENGLYQQFKRDFIATMPQEGGRIKRTDILAWLEAQGVCKKAG